MSTATTRISYSADRARMIRTRKMAYWASTSLAALAFAGLGAVNLAHAAPIMEGLKNLGYPPYFATMLGAWKVLAAVALLAPGLARAKEWAYAGMFFTLTGAALSHALNRDAAASVVAPLVLLGVVMTSWRVGGEGWPIRRGGNPTFVPAPLPTAQEGSRSCSDVGH